MILLAVSDVVWQAVIAAAVTVILAWMNQRTKTAVETTGKEAAEKVKEVKDSLVVSDAETKTELKEIKVSAKSAAKNASDAAGWSNALMAASLKTVADLQREKADRPDARPEDVKAAEIAEGLYRAHVAQQVKMDDAKKVKEATTDAMSEL